MVKMKSVRLFNQLEVEKQKFITNLIKNGLSSFVIHHILVQSRILGQRVAIISKQDGLSADCVQVVCEILVHQLVNIALRNESLTRLVSS